MFRANVNAASLAEDLSPGGVRAFGQSEVSIASSGAYVVEGWNDSTGFFSPCPSPMNKEELTGFGFSNNGGLSFTDLGAQRPTVPRTETLAIPLWKRTRLEVTLTSISRKSVFP